MKRGVLKIGDKSSVGGTVIDGIPDCKHNGTELTYIGAQVLCPACKTTGRIAAKGPRWPSSMMAREQALENDICICECNPHPVMIASQDTMYQSFESQHLAVMGFTSNGTPLSQDDATHTQKFLIKDSSTGLPLRNHRYIIATEGMKQSGKTDSEGYATIKSFGERNFDLHIIFSAPKRELNPDQTI